MQPPSPPPPPPPVPFPKVPSSLSLFSTVSLLYKFLSCPIPSPPPLLTVFSSLFPCHRLSHIPSPPFSPLPLRSPPLVYFFPSFFISLLPLFLPPIMKSFLWRKEYKPAAPVIICGCTAGKNAGKFRQIQRNITSYSCVTFLSRKLFRHFSKQKMKYIAKTI